MGIASALFAGVSGLNSLSAGISVIADNIANINTTGFKASKASFTDVLSQSLGTKGQIGRGAQVNEISGDFSQGSFELSNSPTDLALDGEGFFIVNDGNGDFYTRAGEFRLNSSGELVNAQDLNVQGFAITGSTTAATDSDISLGASLTTAPNVTTTFQAGMNLDVRTSIADTFRSGLTIYDSAGTPITLATTFTKTAGSGAWSYSITSSDGTVSTASATGTINFDGTGTLSQINGVAVGTATEPSILITGLSAGNDMTIAWDLLNAAGTATNGALTGYAATSAVNSLSQDGFAAGSLVTLSVDKSGIVSGLYTNGQTQNLFQLALADFTNPNGLTKLGKGIFGESSTSGSPIPGTGSSGGLGSVTSNALELSNVDLASEFVAMITAQRGFQANTRIINTVDDLMGEVVNLRR